MATTGEQVVTGDSQPVVQTKDVEVDINPAAEPVTPTATTTKKPTGGDVSDASTAASGDDRKGSQSSDDMPFDGEATVGSGAGAGAGAGSVDSGEPAAATDALGEAESKGAEPGTARDAQVSGESKQGLTQYEGETLEFTVKSAVLGETRQTRDQKGEYTEYSVTTTRTLEDGTEVTGTQWHRYSNFLLLQTGLASQNMTFEMPGKKWFGNMDPEFIVQRKAGLQSFIDAVIANDAAASTEMFKAFVLPGLRSDWPAQVGAINLAVHDLPHQSSMTEWWYYNTHLKAADGREYSAFVCFFRIGLNKEHTSYAHALNWAITDVSAGRYISDGLIDRVAPKAIKKTLEKGIFTDPRLRRAMEEVLNKDSVPLPDRMFQRDPAVSTKELNMDMEDATLTKNRAGGYVVHAHSPDGKHSLDLVFAPRKAPVRHGLNGVVKGHDGDDMFYYFIPRCSVQGTLKVDGENIAVSGDGWYDHEFGGVYQENGAALDHSYAWNWAAMQLDNGWEITAAVLYDVRDIKNHKLMETRVVCVGPDGERVQTPDLEFEPLEQWQSIRTFSTYPTKWRVAIPSQNIEVTLTAPVKDQEFVTLLSHPGFWEGRVDVEGTFQGAPVTGRAFVERSGFEKLRTLPGFFKNVGKSVRRAVEGAYPMPPSMEAATLLVATKKTAHWMHGVPLDKLSKYLIEPFRTVADRGGKSWRSYGALACVDVVGGDSRQFVNWLAMPEFMHVGSLIVDDIQDKSETRRGGPCAHHLYGEDICINAGTAAYFQFQTIMGETPLDDAATVRIYDLYFQALRAGHAGQALDIAGLDYLMDDLVATGDATVAEERILAIHRLKTAAPACVLAKMGAVAGKGTEEQIDAIGAYFEAVGVAFQIMDDVLNLRGLYTNEADRMANIALKKLGEDITAGKVTIPVVKAMAKLDQDARQELWDTVRSKPEDTDVVARVIQQLEACGAVDDCVRQATDIVEEKWKVLDACTPDSFAKVMLRSFGWFVIERNL